jgi:spoIIIJ-associated protein
VTEAGMKRFEAPTLEEAYRNACDEFECSMNELKYEIVQYPSKGLFGLFARSAVIVAIRDREGSSPVGRKRDEIGEETEAGVKRPEAARHPSDEPGREVESRISSSENALDKEKSHDEIIERFFDESVSEEESSKEEVPRERELQQEIEERLKELMEISCFEIDVVEVDVIDNTAYIFLDGDDAALLIGKEGYRYNALSYLLFNWLHSRYKLYIKLEIAQFLSTQQEMIRHYIQPVIEHVEREGWGRTRPLDGILVQIALEQLREAFPNKYVAIKRQRDGSRYVLINEFNNRRR